MAMNPTKVMALILFAVAGIVFLYGAIQSYRQALDLKEGLEAFSTYFIIALILAVFGVSFLKGGT